MSARRFTATCSHGTRTDRDAFRRHWTAEHKPVAYSWPVRPITGRAPFRQPRGWRPPTAKAFDPAVGEVGSWVSFDCGGEVTGQVWSVICGGARARVYVADGVEYHIAYVSWLRPAVMTEQMELAA